MALHTFWDSICDMATLVRINILCLVAAKWRKGGSIDPYYEIYLGQQYFQNSYYRPVFKIVYSL
ncbi:MAG: hypothetical protein QM530_06735 [Phycisphaerales bacterium]|nr:hypothetical protein [Phycisphaerales bacterium]